MILKLIPGQRINFRVLSTEDVKGNFGPQVKFRGETPDDPDAVIFLNVDTAERQLSRIGLDTQSVIGRMVEFARTEKNGTKYTDINLPSNGAAKPAPPQKQGYSAGPRIPQIDDEGPAASPAKLDSLFSLYSVCLDHVLAVEVPKLERAKVGASPEAVGAMTATLLIQAAKL